MFNREGKMIQGCIIETRKEDLETGGTMNGQNRENVKPGLAVAIVLKQDQRSGRLTEGVVADLLTNSAFHPHGIKVRLTDGQVGRVSEIRDSTDE